MAKASSARSASERADSSPRSLTTFRTESMASAEGLLFLRLLDAMAASNLMAKTSFVLASSTTSGTVNRSPFSAVGFRPWIKAVASRT